MQFNENPIPTKHPKMFFSKGNIFDLEFYGFDGIALWIPQGLTSISSEYRNFIQQNNPNVVAAIYGHDPQNRHYPKESVSQMVKTSLELLVNSKARNLGLHGIRIENCNAFAAEELVISCVYNWLENGGKYKIDQITLVDKRRGYKLHKHWLV